MANVLNAAWSALKRQGNVEERDITSLRGSETVSQGGFIGPTPWEETRLARDETLEHAVAEANRNTHWEEIRGWEQRERTGTAATSSSETRASEPTGVVPAENVNTPEDATKSSGGTSAGGSVSESAATRPSPIPFVKILISEVQISGTSADDEFVELYNPNEGAVNLSGWKLSKKTASGNESNLMSSQAFSGTIPAKGYVLVTHPEYQGGVLKDLEYSNRSNPLAANNTVLLYDGVGRIVDKLGWSEAGDFEGAVFPQNPASHESLERKASGGSTAEMLSSGEDRYAANAYDTDNNAQDFVLRASADPQHASSFREPRSRPTRITDLAATVEATSPTATLSWTTPSDSDSAQTTLRYDIRYATSAVSETNWASAPSLASSSIPTISAAGSSASTTLVGLAEGLTYFFAIKTEDDTKALSLLSNIPEVAIPVISSSSPASSSAPTTTATPQVVINEIAWMGTASSTNDEWLELLNTSNQSADLSGWQLIISGATSTLTFRGATTISPAGFWLLERTNDDPVSNIAADAFFTGALANSGSKLELRNASGVSVDLVDASTGWFAGINEGTRRVSMERITPTKVGSDPSNWASNDEVTMNGLDAGGNPIRGTPRAQNSRYVP